MKMAITFGDHLIDAGYYDAPDGQSYGHIPADDETIARVAAAIKSSRHLQTDYESDWALVAKDVIDAINNGL